MSERYVVTLVKVVCGVMRVMMRSRTWLILMWVCGREERDSKKERSLIERDECIE